MNIGKFILNVVVVYVAFAVLYTVMEMFVLPDQMGALRAVMKPEDQNMIVYFYYLVETIVFVWLYDKAVGMGDTKAACIFGVMMGVYISAMGLDMVGSMQATPEGVMMPLSIANIVIAVIVSLILGFMAGKGWGVSGSVAAEA